MNRLPLSMALLILGGLILLIGVQDGAAEDKCCSEGIKVIKGVVICGSACCEGFEEIATIPPRMKPIIYCRKIQGESSLMKNRLLREHSPFIWKY